MGSEARRLLFPKVAVGPMVGRLAVDDSKRTVKLRHSDSRPVSGEAFGQLRYLAVSKKAVGYTEDPNEELS